MPLPPHLDEVVCKMNSSIRVQLNKQTNKKESSDIPVVLCFWYLEVTITDCKVKIFGFVVEWMTCIKNITAIENIVRFLCMKGRPIKQLLGLLLNINDSGDWNLEWRCASSG